MNTKFRSVAVALLAMMLCGTAAISSAQQTDEGGAQAWAGHRHGHMGYLAKELNLTDAQKAQIKTMMQAQRTTMRPLMQQLTQNRIDTINATNGGAFDQAKMQALATQRAQLTAQLEVQKAQIHSQIYNQVLTSDQKAKADQLRQAKLTKLNARLQKMSAQQDATPQAQ